MKFLIQSNLLSNQQLEMTKYVMDTYESIDCAVIPFSEEITTTEPLDGLEYFPYGSTSLSNIALSRGFTGLHLNLETFNAEMWEKSNGKNMLNRPRILRAMDAVTALFHRSASLSILSNQVFVRPCEDLKQFTGSVDTCEEHAANLQSMIDSYNQGFPGTYSMNPFTKVAISEVQEIDAEWRWFVVGGKIISGSMYRAHGQLQQIRETDQSVINEAQALADQWLPDSCCVMDTCLLKSGSVKVVEFNTLNSSGFYANDAPAIFDAIAAFHNIRRK